LKPFFSRGGSDPRALSLRGKGNIGIAYTYNEPLVGYEYVMDCAKIAHENGLLNVAVTNGYLLEKPLRNLLPHLDAMNIDLKGFTERFYRKLRATLKR
jgi:pyruvate formate lyase activating enzyme